MGCGASAPVSPAAAEAASPPALHAAAEAAPPTALHAAAVAVPRPPLAAGDGDDHLAVPKTGVAVWWLRRYAEENADALAGKSTSSVCFELVKPATRQLKCAFVDLPQMQALRDSAGRPAVGPAAVFASHAWSNSFVDFVAAVEANLGVGSGALVWIGALSCLSCFITLLAVARVALARL